MRILPILLSCVGVAFGDSSPALWYRQPARDWSEALPIGNGRLAAMVFGGIEAEHFQLNEETIYAGLPMDRTNPAARAALPEIRRLLLADKPREAEQLAAKSFMAVPLRQPPYEPLGDLSISFKGPRQTSASDYRRTLNLHEGVLSVTYKQGDVRYERTAFASYPDHVIVLHLEASEPHKLSFSVALSRSQDARMTIDASFGPATLVLRGQALPPTTGRQKYPGEPMAGTKFTGALRLLSDGKPKALAGGATLEVNGASEATLLFAASTDVRFNDPDADCRRRLQAAAQHSYAELLHRHSADFKALADRVSLDLGDSNRVIAETPTDELLQKTGGEDDQALAALYFAYGRYLLESSSRQDSLAANLQGKWNRDINPPWGSKYTININTEMNYWPAEVVGLSETVDGLSNLLTRMGENGRRTAREMYGTSGFVAHHNTEVWGDTQPIDGVGSGVWPMGAAWLSLTLWERYDYGRDLSYLRQTAYPLMRDAATFLLGNLFEDGAGHLVSGPSLSPENKYISSDGPASLDVSPTMDVEITRALFDRVRKAAELLGVDGDLRMRLREAEARLLPLQIGRYGQLQEWRRDYEEREPGHRHMSHLFAVYPSSEINEETPELWKAARRSLERRLENGGGGTGWSRAWVVCLWATFHEGDLADKSLRVLFEKSTWPNLFDLHPPEIFQIDGNFGATAGMAQMLMQSRGDKITLLPALPRAWASGKVKGLRARGGATVSFEWQDGVVRTAQVHADVDGTWKLEAWPSLGRTITLRRGESWNFAGGSIVPSKN